ncbi:uncharacterized protein ACNS7B_005496 [Menidia menidia]
MSIETAVSFRRRRRRLLVAGCGTCTAETRINDAVRAVKNVIFSPPLPITPPYCSTGLCLYDISQAAGVKVHRQTTRLRGATRSCAPQSSLLYSRSGEKVICMGPTRCGRTLECNNTTVFLTGTVGATLVSWYPLSCVAMLLLASYLSWLCCTTCLNCVIWSNTTL